MLTVLRSTRNTTQRIATPTDASVNCFAAPARKLCCELSTEQLSLFGVSSWTTVKTIAPENDKTGSTARRSETKGRIKVQSSFDKRMRLLIASGLIAGITPTSTRQRSGQRILATAFYALGGVGAE